MNELLIFLLNVLPAIIALLAIGYVIGECAGYTKGIKHAGELWERTFKLMANAFYQDAKNSNNKEQNK